MSSKIWILAAVFVAVVAIVAHYPHYQTATVDATAVNLHSSPDANAGSRLRVVVGGKSRELTLPQGTRVEILETAANGWDKVKVETMGDTGRPPDQEVSGYVKKTLLAIDKPREATITQEASTRPGSNVDTPKAAELDATQVSVDTAYTPKPEQVRQAIINYWDAGDWPRYNELQSRLNAKLSVCRASCAQNGNRWYWTQYGPFNTLEECGRNSCEWHAGDQDFNGYERALSDVQQFAFRSKVYELTVDEPRNYEGNIITYFSARRRGSDEEVRGRAVMQMINGGLIVVEIR